MVAVTAFHTILLAFFMNISVPNDLIERAFPDYRDVHCLS